ncbi:MAG: symbB [Chthonomonadaceae bacterium]|nr:symbB [Chthonomonadaceae bacterium]
MVDLFGLPPLTSQEMETIGIPSTYIDIQPFYPCCTSLPMGWSHSVLVAQLVHERVMYQGPNAPLYVSDNVLCCSSPVINRCLHFAYIDDLCFISPHQDAAAHLQQLMLKTYAANNLKPKMSKLVLPTAAPVDLLGLQIHGNILITSTNHVVSLKRSTHSILTTGSASGRQLSQLIGKWIWVLLLRRPALAVLQHCYRFIEIADTRTFQLWPSVIRELNVLLGLLPLLYTDLSNNWAHAVPATDASLLGAGVCSTTLNAPLPSLLWKQYLSTSNLQCNPASSDLTWPCTQQSLQPVSLYSQERLNECADMTMSQWMDTVQSLHWSVIVSKPWRYSETINAL